MRDALYDRADVTDGVNGVAVAFVVLRASDAGPAKTFVQANGRDVLGHDVEDESPCVFLAVLRGRLSEAFTQRMASGRGKNEESTEDGDIVALSAGAGSPDHGGVVGLRFAEGDVSNDPAVEFVDPRPELVRAQEPPDRVVNSLDGVAVGAVNVDERRLTTALVRRWRADLPAAGVSESIAAKCCRLLRAVLNTAAAEDHIIKANPFRVQGADKENPAEQPTLTVAQVHALADAMPHPRYRVLVLLIAF